MSEWHSAEQLRAAADRLDNEAALANKGKVYISTYTGMAIIHDGNPLDQRVTKAFREATEAEVTALCVIPEFKAYLKKVRGEA